jgi:hypothetical protein
MAVIWISLLLCLSILFPYIMKNSSSTFWNEVVFKMNISFEEYFQTSRASAPEWHYFTKAMAMLFGELEVNEFIKEDNFLTSAFILIFMVVTGFVLLPLMV